MAAIPAGDRTWAVATCAVLTLLVLVVAALTFGWGVHPAIPIGVVAATLVLVATHRWLFEWRTLVSLIVLCILFIPIRRYSFSAASVHSSPTGSSCS